MNRTDRLYALAAELRAAGDRGRTARVLASQFEVSARTIKRDITALQSAGLPIWAAPGPGGGYRMLKQRTPDVELRLTSGEAAAVAIALRTQANLPFAPEARMALTKVLASLAPEQRGEVDDLLSRVWTLGHEARNHAAKVVDQAVRNKLVVSIDYRDTGGSTTTRSVDPLQLANVSGRWYLLAYCRLRAAGRWFRLDRIAAARLTAEPAVHYEVAEVIGEPPPEATALSAVHVITNGSPAKTEVGRSKN